NTVVVSVNDGVTGTTNSFALVVTEVNRPPAFAGATNGTLPEMVGFVRDLGANDPDLPTQALAVKLEQGPTGMVLTNGVLAWTPTEAQGPSTNTLVVSVTDGVVGTTNAFTLVVMEVNTLPILLGATNATINEMTTYTQAMSARDTDLPAQAVTVELLSGPSGMVMTNGVLVWTPTEAQGPSTNTVGVIARDGVGIVTNTFTVFVREVNRLPSLPGATNATLPEMAAHIQSLLAQDPDIPAQSLWVELVSGPAGLVVTNGVIAWTPTEAQGPSTNGVVVRVSDGMASVTNSLTLRVTEVNLPPSFSNITNVTIPEGVAFARNLVPADPDLPVQSLTQRLLQGPRGAVLTHGVFAWWPTEADGPSTNVVQVENFDGALRTTNSFLVRVQEVNARPGFTNIANFVIPEGATLVRNLGAFDTDVPSQALRFQLVQGPPGVVFTNGVFAWAPTEAQGPSTNTVAVSIGDGVATVQATFRVIVTEVNQLPVVQPIPDVTLNEGGRMQVTVVASDADVPAQRLGIEAFLARGATPGNMVATELVPLPVSNGTVTWDTGEEDGPATHGVWVVVSDGVGWVTNRFNVVVREVNQPPSFVGLAGASILVGERYVQPLRTTDPDIPAQEVQIRLLSAPAGMVLTNSTLIWTPESNQGPSTNVLRIECSDGVARVTNAVQVLVRSNRVQTFRIAIGQAVEPGKVGGVATPGAGQVSMPGDVDEYVFDGVAGQWVYVDETLGDSAVVQWECSQANGTPLWEPVGLGTVNVSVEQQDVGRLRLPATAEYRIRVRGVGQHGFRMAAIPQHGPLRIGLTDRVTPGRVNGTNVMNGVAVPSWVGRITEPGEVGEYEFAAQAGQVLHFEFLQADHGQRVYWGMVGADGMVFWETLLAFSGDELPWIEIPDDGLYTISVYGETDETGGYGFQLRDVSTGLGPGRLRAPTLASVGTALPPVAIEEASPGTVRVRVLGRLPKGARLEASDDLVTWRPMVDGPVGWQPTGSSWEVRTAGAPMFYRVAEPSLKAP
ncbi:MAG: hypothetical protein WCR07_14560, partial [Verrucomicrobiota bacterium]